MEGAAWYHYLFLRESMVHRYDAGMYENIRSLDKIVRQILADKHAPDAQRQADRELQLLMFLEIKNEARNGREGWKERLQYLWTYYKHWLLVLIGIAALIGLCLLYTSRCV